jgi:hypothetical protein
MLNCSRLVPDLRLSCCDIYLFQEGWGESRGDRDVPLEVHILGLESREEVEYLDRLSVCYDSETWYPTDELYGFF